MSERPFALHITWTCYGTWLPGDERGSVSNTLLRQGGFVPKANVPGTPYSESDPFTQERARDLQKSAAVWLNRKQALCLANALCDAAQERGWRIVRGAVMANHVHVVLMDCPDDGPAVRRALKGNAQAELSRQNGEPRRWFTSGGSDRYKHSWPAIEAAIAYVANQSGILVAIDDRTVSMPGEMT